jgi:hypothetical protein
VQDKQREILRESLEESVCSRFGTDFQERLGTNPKENFMCEKLLKFIAVVGGRTVRIRTVHTTRKKGHKNRGI